MVVPERYKPQINIFIIKNLGNIISSGLKWTSSAQLLIQLFRVFRLGLLFYFLSPLDFGVFALALIVVQFPSVLTGDSIEAALINENDLTQLKLNSVFWLTIGSSFFIFLIFCFSAQFIAFPLNIKNAATLLPLLAFFFFIESLGRVSRGLLRKNLQFRYLAKLEIFVFLLDTLFTLIFAFLGFGAFALAGGLAVAYTCAAIGYLWKGGYTPGLSFEKKSLISLISFSKNIIAHRYLTWLMRYLDDLIIGVFFGKRLLGIYDRAYSVAHLPMRLITNRINSVLLPAYSTAKADKAAISKIHQQVIELSILFYLPLFCFIFLYSEYLIELLLPASWQDLAWYFPVLCFGGILHALINLNESIFLSFGRSDLQLKYGLLTRGIIIISYLLGMQYGVKGIALAYSIGSLIAFFPETYKSLQLIDLKLRNLYFFNRKSFFFFGVLTFVSCLSLKQNLINMPLGILLFCTLSFIFIKNNPKLRNSK